MCTCLGTQGPQTPDCEEFAAVHNVDDGERDRGDEEEERVRLHDRHLAGAGDRPSIVLHHVLR